MVNLKSFDGFIEVIILSLLQYHSLRKQFSVDSPDLLSFSSSSLVEDRILQSAPFYERRCSFGSFSELLFQLTHRFVSLRSGLYGARRKQFSVDSPDLLSFSSSSLVEDRILQSAPFYERRCSFGSFSELLFQLTHRFVSLRSAIRLCRKCFIDAFKPCLEFAVNFI
ncbi:hypothetical protein F2Q69_00056776 [Brassica cretica]|uniref:Uncharacterized protein n=1 Tax=Brassica cretica TaxID=69181 RepID=A0A8S9MSW6_BRACR|nr:hypothetical protein F2Q69_00056776 [Brassica cretica]